LHQSQQQRLFVAALNEADSMRYKGRVTPGTACTRRIAWAVTKINAQTAAATVNATNGLMFAPNNSGTVLKLIFGGNGAHLAS
jgi:hypothetical protein